MQVNIPHKTSSSNHSITRNGYNWLLTYNGEEAVFSSKKRAERELAQLLAEEKQSSPQPLSEFADTMKELATDNIKCQFTPNDVEKAIAMWVKGGTELVVDPETLTATVKSGDSGQTYHVEFTLDDGWKCDCLGNQHHDHCKHSALVQMAMYYGKCEQAGFYSLPLTEVTPKEQSPNPKTPDIVFYVGYSDSNHAVLAYNFKDDKFGELRRLNDRSMGLYDPRLQRWLSSEGYDIDNIRQASGRRWLLGQRVMRFELYKKEEELVN